MSLLGCANVWLNKIYGFLFQPLYPKSRTLNHFHYTRRKKALTSDYASALNQRPWVRSPVALPDFFRFSVPMSVLSFDGWGGNGLMDVFTPSGSAPSSKSHTFANVWFSSERLVLANLSTSNIGRRSKAPSTMCSDRLREIQPGPIVIEQCRSVSMLTCVL